jgi:hypothetical protein
VDTPDELPQHDISYNELVARVHALVANGTARGALEDDIGWDLGPFLESEARALSDYGVDFLKDLCERLNVPWMAALPRAAPGSNVSTDADQNS